MSYATLTQSQCEETAAYGKTFVERHIPTYTEQVRDLYTDELHGRTYVYTEDEVYEARKYLEELLAQADDPDTIIRLCAARACVKEELRRRWRKR